MILGGSHSGLGVAHRFLDRNIDQLSTCEGAPSYRVILVSPSSHAYWNICAPRALVSPELIPTEDTFVPIEPGFSRHPFNQFKFIQGRATAVDTSARTITIQPISIENLKCSASSIEGECATEESVTSSARPGKANPHSSPAEEPSQSQIVR